MSLRGAERSKATWQSLLNKGCWVLDDGRRVRLRGAGCDAGCKVRVYCLHMLKLNSITPPSQNSIIQATPPKKTRRVEWFCA